MLDPTPSFWGISFPDLPEQNSADEETSGCLLECAACHYREWTSLTLSGVSDDRREDIVSAELHLVWQADRMEIRCH